MADTPYKSLMLALAGPNASGALPGSKLPTVKADPQAAANYDRIAQAMSRQAVDTSPTKSIYGVLTRPLAAVNEQLSMSRANDERQRYLQQQEQKQRQAQAQAAAQRQQAENYRQQQLDLRRQQIEQQNAFRQQQLDQSRSQFEATHGLARDKFDYDRQQASSAPTGAGINDRLPKGWYWNENTGRAEPIPGSKDDRFTGEQGARLGLVQTGLQDVPRIRQIAKEMGSVVNPATQGYFAGRVGELGEMQRLIEAGSEGILRALTGAAATPAEVSRLASRYTPLPSDSVPTRMQKLDLFERELTQMLRMGSGQTTKTQVGQSLGQPNVDDTKSRLKAKYGLE